MPKTSIKTEQKVCQCYEKKLPERDACLATATHLATNNILSNADIQDAMEYAENIVETVRESLLVLDFDLKILTANKSFYNTFKVTANDTIGNYIYDIGNRQWDIPTLRILFEEIIPNKTVINDYEVQHDFPGIGCKTILLNARQITRENIGTHVILLAMEDVTERKKLEYERDTALNLIQKITSQVPGVVFQFCLNQDGSSNFPFASEKLREFFLVEPTEAHEDSSKVFARIDPEDYNSVVASIQKSSLELTPWEQEYRVNLNDDAVRWYFGSSLPHREKNGSILWDGFTSDITERKQMEVELREAKYKAESANIAKSEFLANMSHEIRTPINGLFGMTQLLELTDLTDEQRDYVATLKKSGKSLLSLINDILDLSKIESGKIILESSEFSLVQSIKNLVTMQKQIAYDKGLALEVDVHKDIPNVLIGDQRRIKQILLNLLGNALKFTAHGSITISLKQLERHDETILVQIAVQDTGIGISPEAMEDIFMRFVQEDGSISRRYGGTGLGLTISRRLVELMGGSLSVESTQGVGSCFRVNLPFTISKSVITEQETPSIKFNKEALSLRILFVEDEPTSRNFGVSLLTKMGHEVTSVDDGRKCLSSLEQSKFDLVFMDIQMPVMNGEDAIKEIRKRELDTSFHQPAIALTAYSLRGDKEKFLDAGFNGYLSKPLEMQHLISEMKRVMGLVVGTNPDGAKEVAIG